MPPSHSTTADILALADIVKASADAIVKSCAASSQDFPSPNEPFSPATEAARMSPVVQEQSGLLVAAAAQLIALVRPPPLTLMMSALQFHVSSGLRTVIQLHVPEILRTAGAQGLHVNDIAAYTGTDPPKLARILRLLATSHIFREVTPDVFTLNRISSLLDTGKDIKDILAHPDDKHDNTLGIAALIELQTDEGFKSAAYLPETLLDKDTAKSGDPNKTPFCRAMNTDLPIWAWFELPENAYVQKRFAMGMEGVQNIVPQDAILKGFEWSSLPEGSTIVDVGGGIGSQSFALAKAYKHLKFIIQDRPPMIANGVKFWDAQLPDAIQSGRVKFEVHDFFLPQPESILALQPAVFLLRMIMHDWSDKYCINILSHLRAAAGANTQLVVIDNLVTYACADPESVQDIEGATLPPAPAPLLPNFGETAKASYFADMHMLVLLNGIERTVAQFKEIFEASGWKLSKIVMAAGFRTQDVKIIGTPA